MIISMAALLACLVAAPKPAPDVGNTVNLDPDSVLSVHRDVKGKGVVKCAPGWEFEERAEVNLFPKGGKAGRGLFGRCTVALGNGDFAFQTDVLPVGSEYTLVVSCRFFRSSDMADALMEAAGDREKALLILEQTDKMETFCSDAVDVKIKQKE
jgi:hypothetical protein